MYMGFLMSEPKSPTCTRLGEVMGLSHDSVNRFLLRESYEPYDLFKQARGVLNVHGGVLSVDDSTLDKPYSRHMALVGHFWSGKHHRVVKGVNLITLYYTDPQGRGLPVNDRVYDKSEDKTKNDYFLDMLAQVLQWGLEPKCVTGDSWYASVDNLKTVRNHRLGFLFAIESNRKVSLEKGAWAQVQQLEVPVAGVKVWLRDFGEVNVFRTRLKEQVRHYIVWLPESGGYESFGTDDFQELHDQHWKIEQYHRVIKQVCSIEKFQVRNKTPILNHIFAALCGYVHLQQMQFDAFIQNAYHWKQDLFNEVVASFVSTFIHGKEHLNPQFNRTVKA